MILCDIEGGLFSIISTVTFCNGNIVINEIKSDYCDCGYQIEYTELDIVIRLYKSHKLFLKTKDISDYTDDEIGDICETIFKEYIGKVS